MAWAIKVIWNTGDEELVLYHRYPAVFPTKRKAQEQADFLKMGIEEDVQSINVVKYNPPKVKAQ